MTFLCVVQQHITQTGSQENSPYSPFAFNFCPSLFYGLYSNIGNFRNSYSCSAYSLKKHCHSFITLLVSAFHQTLIFISIYFPVFRTKYPAAYLQKFCPAILPCIMRQKSIDCCQCTVDRHRSHSLSQYSFPHNYISFLYTLPIHVLHK